MRAFVKKYLERRGSLIARIQARDRDTKRIDSGVGAGPIRIRNHVHADFLVGPPRLVNVRQALRNPLSLLAHRRSHLQNPVAVGLIVFGPEARAVDGSGCFQHLRQARRQSGIAKFTLPAGKFVAILEVAELVL